MRPTETQLRLALTCRSECRIYCEYPCPCGYAGDPEKECTCSPTLISRYQKRLSGSLLDRIDIHIEVPRGRPQKVADLARLLAPHFYAPPFVIEDAVRKRGQFNAIHL